MNEEVNVIKNFSAIDEKAELIKNSLVKVAKFAMYNDSKYGKMADKTFSTTNVENYDKENQEAKLALLAFCADKAGINTLETKADVINAFENVNFRTVFNSIIVDVLQSIYSCFISTES